MKKKRHKFMIGLTNEKRAKLVGKFLRRFAELVGDTNNNDITLVDFLADLRHWARINSVDYSDADRQAIGHFEAEINEEA